MDTIFFFATLGVGVILLFTKLLFELQMMQQNSYRGDRYIRWFFSKNTPDRFRPLEQIVTIVAITLIFTLSPIWSYISTALLFCFVINRVLKRKQKKKLVITARTKRLLITAILLTSAISILSVFSIDRSIEEMKIIALTVVTALSLTLSPLLIVIANIIIAPVERRVNRWYYRDAQKRLAKMPNLKIIGITGSYGKTSTKHFLHRILTEEYNVLMTPGSYNTTMGVIRTIREQLKPTHEVFIVEMGAKQRGDIADICNLVNPQMGILTAVGPQHLESFKTIEGVQKTKFELIDALPKGGLAILNADYDKIRERPVTNVTSCLYSSNDSSFPFFIKDISYSNGGSQFTVCQNTKSDPKKDTKNGAGKDTGNSVTTNIREVGTFSTKLLGDYNLSNILASIIVAECLEVPLPKIAYAIKRLEPVQHRLEIKRQPNGVTVIDDAFNSNPVGSKMALEILGAIEGDRKIIVTPGMIELGEEQDNYNRLFGGYIAKTCDHTILVGKRITEPIQKGLKEANYPEEKLYVAENFKDAISHLNGMIRKGDVILYENDLPDTYES